MFTLLMIAQLAMAQTDDAFVDVNGPHLTPADLTWGLGTTVGAPAVFMHTLLADPTTTTTDTGTGTTPEVIQPRIMLYETQVAAADADCPVGKWGIGWAFSADGGVTWTDQGPLVEPTDDRYYSCVAAHPRAVPQPGSSSWLVYFKAEQNVAQCEALATTPAYGCDRYPGVGRFGFNFQGFVGTTLTYGRTGIATNPVLQNVAQDMGYPSVVVSGSRYRMMFGQNPDIFYVASATSSFTSPTSGPTAVILAGTNSEGVGDDEMLSPSVVCAGGTPYKVFVSGRTYMPYPVIADQNMGQYLTNNWSTYAEGTGPYTSTADGDQEMRHVFVVSSDAGTEFSAYYSTPASGGGNEIYSVSTAGFDPTLDSKRCP